MEGEENEEKKITQKHSARLDDMCESKENTVKVMYGKKYEILHSKRNMPGTKPNSISLTCRKFLKTSVIYVITLGI